MNHIRRESSEKWLFRQRIFIMLLATLPIFYTFFLIQYSAITVPFWDHVELIDWLVPIFDGEFSFLDLLKPHNHTRPLVYRLVMLLNARLTDWDIRSEYVYMLMAIYGTFLVHFWALKNLTTNSVDKRVFPIAVLLISLILFSPVGHNNHWWSMMFQLNITNLFVAFGLLFAFIKPDKIISQLAAAVSLWLASFTLTNGLFAILAIIITFQLSSRRWFIPNKFSMFWGLNLLVILLIYLPGLSSSESSSKPDILSILQFIPSYLGSPLAGLLWFPYKNMFDIPAATGINMLVGFALLLICALLIRHSCKRNPSHNPSTLILIGFSLFALISSAVTAWGRASFDDFGVANANASRYSVFSAYLLLGQIYYVSTTFFAREKFLKVQDSQISKIIRPLDCSPSSELNSRSQISKMVKFFVVVFVILSFASYIRGVQVYLDANEFNKQLSRQYTWGTSLNEADSFIHPKPDRVINLKADLQRLELGPYRNRAFKTESLEVGEFEEAGLLTKGSQYSQRFVATDNRLKAILVTLVRPNGTNTLGRVSWAVNEVKTSSLVIRGTIDSSQIEDWEFVRLKLPFLESSKDSEYVLTISSDASPSTALGVALYRVGDVGLASQVMVSEGATSTAVDLTMKIGLDYVD